MKKYVLSALLIVFGLSDQAQLLPHKYLVKFTDKNNSPYTISDPSQYLSPRALARRAKQSISIKYNDLPVTPFYVDSVVSTGVTLLCRSKWFNSVSIYTVDSNALNKIKSFPFVLSVDSITTVIPPEKVNPLIADKPSNILCNPESKTEKASNYNYGYAANQINMIAGEYLHDIGYCGQGITIAILDAGFWNVDSIAAFDSLWYNNQILGTRDFVDPGGNVFRQNAHGMYVLSAIAANIPGRIIGTAPKANFLLLRSEDASSENIIEEYNWTSSAEYADSAGADIINSSLSYTTFDGAWMNHTYADMNGHTCPSSIAASIAASKGIVVCNSAGNDGYFGDTWHYIGAPADADSIITVGAVDAFGNYYYASSTGPTADGRIKPTVAAQGEDTYVVSTTGNAVPASGTSFSSPVIAGATACLIQAFPNASNMQIINAIIKSASQYTHPDSLQGWGIPNYAVAAAILSNITVRNFDGDNSINVFPNPFSDIIYLLFNSNDTNSMNIDIYDLRGRRVYLETGVHRNKGYNFLTLENINNLANGVYFIRISSNNKVFRKKIMKQN
jgi:hypothetical protein